MPDDVEHIVKPILEDVQKNGDEALKKYTSQFDKCDLDSLIVSEEEIEEAKKRVNPRLIEAMKKAIMNIETFHKSNIQKKEAVVEVQPGVKAWREFRAIEKVGLYVPGGKATYPSTVMMLATPARVAGCKEIIICTPAGPDGKCNDHVLTAASLCGVTKVFKIGGAQAVAAMAYGTESIPKVYKIFGPGNQFVTTAKMLVYGEVDIDMPAGPSEVGIIADETAPVNFVAADLLSQLEHAEDSQAVLFTTSEKFAKEVMEEMEKQTEALSRKEIIKESMKKSYVVLCKDNEEICEIANEYAAEHLEIITENDEYFLEKINNAGSIFLGKYSSEPLGDYATGTNHTLPTSGYAKMFPALSTESFGKKMQVQRVEKEGIAHLYPIVEAIANAEGLDAHKNAVAMRNV